MRRAIAGLMLGAVVAAPAHAERFAISCSGKSIDGFQRSSNDPIVTLGSPTKIKDLIYVIDEEAQTVRQYVAPKRELAPVCEMEGMTCSTAFSADRVTITGTGMKEGYRVASSFDWDRRTNRLETILHMSGATGAGMVLVWTLKCRPTAMPAVDAPAAG